jgi:hypothetical protein
MSGPDLIVPTHSAVPSQPWETALLRPRAYDQELAERHHASLNYPADLLIRALTLAVSGSNLLSQRGEF